MAGLNLCLDNLIALLQLNLFFFFFFIPLLSALSDFKNIPLDEVKRLARPSNHGTIKNCGGYMCVRRARGGSYQVVTSRLCQEKQPWI